MDKLVLDELIDKSFDVKQKSYCAYSKFRVGASVLCEDGTIIVGTNVENASLGLSLCAERSAFCSAVSLGHRRFKAVVISSDLEKEYIVPCGACRQFMSEFGLDIDVYMTKPDRTYMCKKLKELLPHAFTEFPI